PGCTPAHGTGIRSRSLRSARAWAIWTARRAYISRYCVWHGGRSCDVGLANPLAASVACHLGARAFVCAFNWSLSSRHCDDELLRGPSIDAACGSFSAYGVSVGV